MATKISRLIFFDSLFTPIYVLTSTVLPLFFKANTANPKVVVIKFFGMGSIVRLATALEDTDFSVSNIRLITLAKNKELADLLGIKTMCIRSNNPFVLIVDTMRVFWNSWRLKNVTIVDLERTSKLSGIFRLICTLGKSCSSYTFKSQNFEKNNQRFISLQGKTAMQAIMEVFDLKVSTKQAAFKEPIKNGKIAININAGDYLKHRKYPINHFTKVISLLNKSEWTSEFILIGSLGERAYARKLTEQLSQVGINYTNTIGELSLKELAELLQNCQLLITNDSGPLHLAYYYQVPIVAIWGPTSPYLVGYSDSSKMKNISLRKECSPCFIHPKSKVAEFCKGRIDCLVELNPQKVVNVALGLLQNKNESASNVE